MKYSKSSLLDKAYEITKAYASSNGTTPLATVLKNVYEELVLINEELDK